MDPWTHDALKRACQSTGTVLPICLGPNKAIENGPFLSLLIYLVVLPSGKLFRVETIPRDQNLEYPGFFKKLIER